MSASTLTLSYVADPAVQKVIVTGTFDDWGCTLQMTEGGIQNGMKHFKAPIPVPTSEKTIQFKFIVDSKWVCSEDYGKVNSGEFLNNFIHVDCSQESHQEKAAEEKAEKKEEPSVLPETPLEKEETLKEFLAEMESASGSVKQTMQTLARNSSSTTLENEEVTENKIQPQVLPSKPSMFKVLFLKIKRKLQQCRNCLV